MVCYPSEYLSVTTTWLACSLTHNVYHSPQAVDPQDISAMSKQMTRLSQGSASTRDSFIRTVLCEKFAINGRLINRTRIGRMSRNDQRMYKTLTLPHGAHPACHWKQTPNWSCTLSHSSHNIVSSIIDRSGTNVMSRHNVIIWSKIYRRWPQDAAQL